MTIVFETKRLVLRRFTLDDADNLLGLERDPDVLRHLGRKPLEDADACRRHLLSFLLPYYDRPEGLGGWAVLEKSSGEFIGIFSLKPARDSRSAAEMGFGPDEVEIGYGLRKSSWGNGYATELAQALVRRAFTELGISCLTASVSLANEASIRVLQKAGLQRVEELFWLPDEEGPSVKFILNKQSFDLASSPIPPG